VSSAGSTANKLAPIAIFLLVRCAKDRTYPHYNLGVILSRTLSYGVAHNKPKPLYVGAIAIMVDGHIKEERTFRNIGH
jgi:hypothetical protein